jgi:hypothetical protein
MGYEPPLAQILLVNDVLWHESNLLGMDGIGVLKQTYLVGLGRLLKS